MLHPHLVKIINLSQSRSIIIRMIYISQIDDFEDSEAINTPNEK